MKLVDKNEHNIHITDVVFILDDQGNRQFDPKSGQDLEGTVVAAFSADEIQVLPSNIETQDISILKAVELEVKDSFYSRVESLSSNDELQKVLREAEIRIENETKRRDEKKTRKQSTRPTASKKAVGDKLDY